MPKFAANLTMLFGELGFLERFKAAAENGFTGVEYLFPYAYDKNVLAEKLSENGLRQVLHNLPAGDWDGGERGIACLQTALASSSRCGARHRVRYCAGLPAGELPDRKAPKGGRRQVRATLSTTAFCRG